MARTWWKIWKRRLRTLPDRFMDRGEAPVLPPEQRRGAFEEVYSRKLWGEGEGDAPFFSGPGSRGESASGYVETMAEIIRGHERELGRPLTVVDIGCGDFEIGRALVAALPEIRYVGCDIVPALIEHHSAVHASDRVSFRRVDIVVDRPPEGEVCLVRQVFQHLSNAEIAAGLKNLDEFPFLYVTEGQPRHRVGPYNPDKQAGGHIRFGYEGIGRGVELKAPPFSRRTAEVCRIPSPPHEIIVTERVYLQE